jgi:hypothetical protein
MMKWLKAHWVGVTVFVILAIMSGLMFFSSKGDSNIVDEIAHIPSGYSYITRGDYRLNPEHPPLIKDLAAVPLLFTGAKFPYAYWEANNPVVNNQWEMGWKFLYQMGNDPQQLTILARIPIMMMSVLFCYLVFLWSRKLYGDKAGVLAVTLYAFNTAIIAHSRFVTTDLGVSFAFFVNMFVLYYYIQKPTWKRLIWTGLSFALVLITKFSAAVCVPTYFIVLLMLTFKNGLEKPTNILEAINGPGRMKRFWAGTLSFIMIGLIGVVAMWVFYLPHVINMPAQVQVDLINESVPATSIYAKVLTPMSGNIVTKPLAQYFLGFFMVSGHVGGGHDAFFLGMVSNQGWWYYYPVVLALKTQIGFFILFVIMAIYWKRTGSKGWFTEWYLWTLPVALMYLGMTGKLNLGVRYMLPIYAFAIVYVSKVANAFDFSSIRYLWNRKVNPPKNSSAVASILIGLAVVWYVGSALIIYPHYLAYYNEFIGGYQNGYKYLTDSNTDWGQDVKRLSEYVDANDIDQIYVDVFPGSMPAKYYLGDKMVEWHVQNGQPPAGSYFALSATFYQNSRLKKSANGGMDYSWVDNLTPIDNIGGSILIFKMP